MVRARLRGRKAATGGSVELLLLREEGEACWLAMAQPGRRLSPGTQLQFSDGQLVGRIVDRVGPGRVLVRFEGVNSEALIEGAGELPLPPYIRRPEGSDDAERYQTVYARERGAVAAPTAGLHFTEALLGEITSRGTALVPLVLHVGPGTFEPIRTEDPRQHEIDPEYYELAETSAASLRHCRGRQGRIVAVGTTVVRTLETIAAPAGDLRAARGWSGKFIYPPYEFRAVDALVTNFHLPRTSLLLLVAAFAGRDLLLETYRVAVENRYRFYSYGDAMLIL